MHVIGLTGGIGSGKSTVANLFAQAGISVINMDAIAHQLTVIGAPAYEEILKNFSSSILNPDKTINRRQLAHEVFNNAKQLKVLESILHPKIQSIVEQQLKQLDATLCVIEIPLLNSRNQFPFLDSILVIDCSPEQQIRRTQKRNSINKPQIKAIMNAQLDRASRLKLADDIIDNNGTIEALHDKVHKLISKYTIKQAESMPEK